MALAVQPRHAQLAQEAQTSYRRGAQTTHSTESSSFRSTLVGPYAYKSRAQYVPVSHDEQVGAGLHVSSHGCPMCANLVRLGSRGHEVCQPEQSVYHPMAPHLITHDTGHRQIQMVESSEYSQKTEEIRAGLFFRGLDWLNPPRVLAAHAFTAMKTATNFAAVDAVHSFIRRGTELARICRLNRDEASARRLDALCGEADRLRGLVSSLASRGDPDSPDLYGAARQLRDALLQLQEAICDTLLERMTDVYSETAYWAQRLETSSDQEMPALFYEWTTTAVELSGMAVSSGLGTDRLGESISVEGAKLKSQCSQLQQSFAVRKRRDEHSIVDAKCTIARVATDLSTLVCEAAGYPDLIAQTEGCFFRRMADCERAMINGQGQDGLEHAVKAGRLATWAAIVADESAKHVAGRDDATHKAILSGIDNLEHATATMASYTKQLLTNLSDQMVFQQWKKSHDTVAKWITYLKELIIRADDFKNRGQPPAPTKPMRPVTPVSIAESLPEQRGGEQRIMSAAHGLHKAVNMWSTSENELVAEAKRIAMLMAKMSQLVRGIGGDKQDLITCANAIADSADRLDKLALQVAHYAGDGRIQKALTDISLKTKTIASQLKMLCVVKLAILETYDYSKDPDAFENLVVNAQNLMRCVQDTVHFAEAASIKMRASGGTLRMRWVKRGN